jgi:hypothetical protein
MMADLQEDIMRSLPSRRREIARRALLPCAALALLALAGCVVYPAAGPGYAYTGPDGAAYYAPAYGYVAPPVFVGWGGGWGYYHHPYWGGGWRR